MLRLWLLHIFYACKCNTTRPIFVITCFLILFRFVGRILIVYSGHECFYPSCFAASSIKLFCARLGKNLRNFRRAW